MFKSYYIKIAVLGALIALTACKDDIETYSGESGIFFAVLESGSDDSKPSYTENSSLPFALTNERDSTLTLRAKIIGGMADYDRQVSVEIVAEKSTAVSSHDYEPLSQNIAVKAGEIYAYIPIHFLRQPSLDGKEVTLTLRLKENNHFKLLMPRWLWGVDKEGVNVIEHSLVISDKYMKLGGWSDSFFGPYSDKKIKLMCELFDLTLNDFQKDSMIFVERRVLGQKLDKYLKEMEAKGQTVYEDELDADGNRVKMTAGSDIN